MIQDRNEIIKENETRYLEYEKNICELEKIIAGLKNEHKKDSHDIPEACTKHIEEIHYLGKALLSFQNNILDKTRKKIETRNKMNSTMKEMSSSDMNKQKLTDIVSSSIETFP